MANNADVIQLMAVMSLAYPSFQLKDGQAELYFQMLQDVPRDLLEAASKQLINTSIFFPSIAEWRSSVVDLQWKAAGIPTPFEAWAETVRNIAEAKKHQYDPQPNFTASWSHPLVKEAVDLVGWMELVYSDLNEFDRMNFIKAFESITTRAKDELRMLPETKAAIFRERIGVDPAALPEVKAAVGTMNGIKQLADKMRGGK